MQCFSAFPESCYPRAGLSLDLGALAKPSLLGPGALKPLHPGPMKPLNPVGPIGPIKPPIGPIGPIKPPIGPIGPIIPKPPIGPIGPIQPPIRPIGPIIPKPPIGPIIPHPPIGPIIPIKPKPPIKPIPVKPHPKPDHHHHHHRPHVIPVPVYPPLPVVPTDIISWIPPSMTHNVVVSYTGVYAPVLLDQTTGGLAKALQVQSDIGGQSVAVYSLASMDNFAIYAKPVEGEYTQFVQVYSQPGMNGVTVNGRATVMQSQGVTYVELV